MSRRMDELETRLHGLHFELSAPRASGDLRAKEAHQLLVRRIDSLHAAAADGAESTRRNMEEMSALVRKLDQRQSAHEQEVAIEIVNARASAVQEACVASDDRLLSGIEDLRRELKKTTAETTRRT